MARKLMSLALAVALLPISGLAATCDVDCLLTHSHHSHRAAQPTHHEHHSAHMHSARATETGSSLNAVQQCHEGISRACSRDCIWKTKASGNAISSTKQALAYSSTETLVRPLTGSDALQARQSFLAPDVACQSAVLRI